MDDTCKAYNGCRDDINHIFHRCKITINIWRAYAMNGELHMLNSLNIVGCSRSILMAKFNSTITTIRVLHLLELFGGFGGGEMTW